MIEAVVERPGSANSVASAQLAQEQSFGYNSIQEWVETTSARHPHTPVQYFPAEEAMHGYRQPGEPAETGFPVLGPHLHWKPKQYSILKGTHMKAGAALQDSQDSYSPLSDSAAALKTPLRAHASLHPLNSHASQQMAPEPSETSWTRGQSHGHISRMKYDAISSPAGQRKHAGTSQLRSPDEGGAAQYAIRHSISNMGSLMTQNSLVGLCYSRSLCSLWQRQ